MNDNSGQEDFADFSAFVSQDEKPKESLVTGILSISQDSIKNAFPFPIHLNEGTNENTNEDTDDDIHCSRNDTLTIHRLNATTTSHESNLRDRCNNNE